MGTKYNNNRKMQLWLCLLPFYAMRERKEYSFDMSDELFDNYLELMKHI